MGILDVLLSNKKDETIDPSVPQNINKGRELSLSDFLAPAALKVTPKNILLGEKIARTLFVVAYPSDLTDNWLTPIINLDKVYDVSIYVHPIDTAKILHQFQKKVAEVESQIELRQQRGLVNDPELDIALRNIEDIRSRLTEAQERLFDVGLYITIYEDSEEALDKAEKEIQTMLESHLIIIKPAIFQQEEGLKTTSPLGNDLLDSHQKLNTEPLASFFPFVSFDLTSEDGILYGVNRQNSSLVIFDRFKMENYNSIIFAKSGSGKSFATKLEILRTLMFDASVIVIDPEKEYESLSQAVGGKYFNISLSSEHHINPFDLPIPREDEAPADILRSNIINLVGLFRLMLGGLTPEEDSIVDRAIVETYALKDITPETSWAGIPAPLLSDFESVLSGMEGSASIVSRLGKYTKGSWSTFLNQPSNIDINNRFVVYSVRDMEDELKPIAMYIITHYIWNDIRKELKKRLLVIDEAWWMMKSDDTASFLYSIAKRGRKYYLGLCTITQDVSDFMKSSYGAPIVTNSSIQILLKQHPSAIENLQKVFNLTDEEKYLLLECNVGEGIFFAGTQHVAIRVEASEIERRIITTNPEDLLKIERGENLE